MLLSKAIDRIKITPNPIWIEDLVLAVERQKQNVLNCDLLREAKAGTLSSERGILWLTQIYPTIETFPQWIAINIAKVEESAAKTFLIDNLRVERNHALQWVVMCEGLGIYKRDLQRVVVLPEVDALNNWLWSINYRGTLAESISATNYALEGIAFNLALLGLESLPKYANRSGVSLNESAFQWVKNHSKYDDKHPLYALEIMKKYAKTLDIQKKVVFAATRSLQYLLMAFEACYRHGNRQGL